MNFEHLNYLNCNIFRDAAMMTMRRKIAGKTPEEIRQLKRSELEAPVSLDDLTVAMDKTRFVFLNYVHIIS